MSSRGLFPATFLFAPCSTRDVRIPLRTENEAARHGIHINRDGRRRAGFELLSLPDVTLARLQAIWPELAEIKPKISSQIEVDARYAAYVARQEEDVAALKRDEAIAIPGSFDYAAIPGLSNELRQKFAAQRPATLAQAGRIEGVTPAALVLLQVHIKKAAARNAGKSA